MINITKRARQQLKEILSSTVDMPQARLRLVSRDRGQLGLGIDIEMPDDECFEHDGLTVLVVARELAVSLNRVTLDVEDNGGESELIICNEAQ